MAVHVAKHREPTRAGEKAAQTKTPGRVQPDAVVPNPRWQRLATAGSGALALGRYDDPLEREADRVADVVMRDDDATVRRVCSGCAEEQATVRRQPVEDEEPDELVQRKAAPGPGGGSLTPALARQVQATRHGGEALSPSVRAFFEPRFGRDLGDVRIHRDTAAADAASALAARAYTVGADIAFAPGQYQPCTSAGRRLLAHELVHTRQQTDILQRKPLEDLLVRSIHNDVARSLDDTTLADSIEHLHLQLGRTSDASEREGIRGNLAVLEAEAARRRGPSGPPQPEVGLGETFGPPAPAREGASEPGLAGTEIGDYGIAYKAEGVNLRDKPGSSPDSKVLGRLAFNTRMYVHSLTDGHYLVGTDDGRLGYVAVSHVKTGLPEPDAKIYQIQPGDTALGISRKHYGGEAEWGADHRFFVNGLVHVNQGPGQRGIYKPDPNADWDTTAVRAGYMIWVPSLAFMRSLKGVVSSGSITYEAWQKVKRAAIAVGEFLLGTGAFVVGLLHGALESVWDVLVGLKDLLVLAYDLIKWLIGLITGDSKGLFDSLKDVNWGELVQGWIDDFLAKWNHDSILRRWHFRGWVIGYAIAEVVMLFLSGGVIQGIKWVGKSAKVAKVISSLPKVAKLAETAKSSRLGQRLASSLSAAKGGAMTARAATAFVFNLLKKPASIWNKGPDEIAEALQKAGYKVVVAQSERGSKLSKQIRIVEAPSGAPPITRIQVHPGGGRHGGSYYKISSSDPSFGTKWIADKATFKLQPGMDPSKIVWVEAKLEGWLLRAVAANAAAQRARREAAE